MNANAGDQSSSPSCLTASVAAAVEGLPRYRCHKVVRAVKILSMGLEGEDSHPVVIPAHPNDDGDSEPIPVSHEWVEKHDPKVGGYLVVYEDGYMSFSPAEAFEAGYVPVDGARDRELADVLGTAAAQLRGLRRTNEVLAAKVQVLDLVGSLLMGPAPRYGGMGMEEDVLGRLERLRAQLGAS